MESECGVGGLESKVWNRGVESKVYSRGVESGMEAELWSRRCRVWSRGVWAFVHQWNFDVRLKETCVFLLC